MAHYNKDGDNYEPIKNYGNGSPQRTNFKNFRWNFYFEIVFVVYLISLQVFSLGLNCLPLTQYHQKNENLS